MTRISAFATLFLMILIQNTGIGTNIVWDERFAVKQFGWKFLLKSATVILCAPEKLDILRLKRLDENYIYLRVLVAF